MSRALRAPRPPYAPGAEVFGIWFEPGAGTVGGYGQVTACTPRDDGAWTLTARFGQRIETYRLSRTGHSDYVDRPLRADSRPAAAASATDPLGPRGDDPMSTATPATTLPETQRRRRGHAFYPPTALAATIPALYATEDMPCEAKTIHLHYFAGGCDWWIAEYDPATGRAFGYACLGDPSCAEWGYIDLPDLERVTVGGGLVIVERDLDWTPTSANKINLSG